MFARFYELWYPFIWNTLGLRHFWADVFLIIPYDLFYYEVTRKYGSIDAYEEFKKQKGRLAKHQKRFRDLDLK